MPFPHVWTGLQSLSLSDVAPDGQQPSLSLAAVTCRGAQRIWHGDLVRIVSTHASPDCAQRVGQSPSHSSPLSRTPLPHCGSQSLSLFAFAPDGQQESPSRGFLTSVRRQLSVQSRPVSSSVVQDRPSSQSDCLG